MRALADTTARVGVLAGIDDIDAPVRTRSSEVIDNDLLAVADGDNEIQVSCAAKISITRASMGCRTGIIGFGRYSV